MKKLYIPTSSLNFNNILSSESVSPAAFYARRTFGYKRWTKTEENTFENVIVLYDSLLKFSRPKSDIEDHPMIIEVSLPEEEIIEMYNIGDKYLCNHTVYLTPFSSRFLFFNESDKTKALSLSEASIETKYAGLYSKTRISVVTPPDGEYSKLTEINLDSDFNTKALELDTKINKMKGLLFGYYIGHILSADFSDIQKINTYRQIKDIFAAILSSMDKKPTSAQMATLNGLFSTISPLYDEFLTEVKDRNIVLRLLDIIRKKGYSNSNAENLSFLLNGLKKSKNDDDSPNPSMEWVNSNINDIERTMKQKTDLLEVDKPEILVNSCQLVYLENRNAQGFDNQLAIAWVNDVLSRDVYDGNINPFKERLSDDITLKAKDFFSKEEWENSKVKVTLNGLRRHIRGAEFEHDWSNDIYSAIAAVLTHGDDWHKLLQFTQGKGMTDLSIPFALYGELNGFAGLPRDFTDNLLTNDRKYIARIYEEFYGELFDKRLPREEKVKGTVLSTTLSNHAGCSTLSLDARSETSTNTYNSKKNFITQDNVNNSEFEAFFAELVKKVSGATLDKNIYRFYYDQFGLTEKFLQSLSEDKSINNGKSMQKTASKFIKSKLKSKRNEYTHVQTKKNNKGNELVLWNKDDKSSVDTGEL